MLVGFMRSLKDREEYQKTTVKPASQESVSSSRSVRRDPALGVTRQQGALHLPSPS